MVQNKAELCVLQVMSEKKRPNTAEKHGDEKRAKGKQHSRMSILQSDDSVKVLHTFHGNTERPDSTIELKWVHLADEDDVYSDDRVWQLELMQANCHGEPLYIDTDQNDLIQLRYKEDKLNIDRFFKDTNSNTMEALLTVLKAHRFTVAVFGMRELVSFVNETLANLQHFTEKDIDVKEMAITLDDEWRSKKKKIKLTSQKLIAWAKNQLPKATGSGTMAAADAASPPHVDPDVHEYMTHRIIRQLGHEPSPVELADYIQKTLIGGFYGFAGFKPISGPRYDARKIAANIVSVETHLEGLRSGFLDRTLEL